MRQTALASGFADLISTQLASFELERQDELTARVELRALQSQVDPHFLFNTISTIVSLVRTEPDKARSLLIDFSNYYRQTLSDSDTLTTLEHEVEQALVISILCRPGMATAVCAFRSTSTLRCATAWYRRLSCSRCSKTASSMRSARPSRFLFVLGLLRPMTAWRSSSKMTASG
ncbi:MAG: histidine kinase [Collinsella sp.]